MSCGNASCAARQPWYSAGLRFECTACGNCCSGGPGYVWVTEQELARIASFLGVSPQAAADACCRIIGGRISLRELRNAAGQYDCIFLVAQPDGRRLCRIYDVRPAQCRAWPFWDGNLIDPDAWRCAARKCPGIDRGRIWSAGEIEAARRIMDW